MKPASEKSVMPVLFNVAGLLLIGTLEIIRENIMDKIKRSPPRKLEP